MKKYLIKGALALVVGGFAASCADHDVDYVPIDQQRTQTYKEVFKELIGGDVDPNHNWGFEKVAIPAVTDNAASSARANTRGYIAEANDWAQNGWNVPAVVGDAESRKVIAEFSKEHRETTQSVTFTNFFVQQVYKGEATYTAYDGSGKGAGSNYMNYLTCGNNDEHIYNFNWGQGSNVNVNYDYTPIEGEEIGRAHV